ncbi:MAG: DUF6807 family protein [Puniceicoccaceae bacterium]
MQTTITTDYVEFRDSANVAGIYVLNDPFKPYFRELRTPAGHNVVHVSPGDHRHHKGLMYALKTTEVNFWEEDPDSGKCGIQEILATEPVPGGFCQKLLWREEIGNWETYQETRTITCRSSNHGYDWTWHTRRTSLRDHLLVKSDWALDLEDGRKINYHGLGIRFPWMWCFGGSEYGTVEMDSKPVEVLECNGSRVRSVGFTGLIDGQWNRTEAAVTISQDHTFGWFALRSGFPYLSVGPSVLEEVTIKKGETIEEIYSIRVEDR